MNETSYRSTGKIAQRYNRDRNDLGEPGLKEFSSNVDARRQGHMGILRWYPKTRQLAKRESSS